MTLAMVDIFSKTAGVERQAVWAGDRFNWLECVRPEKNREFLTLLLLSG